MIWVAQLSLIMSENTISTVFPIKLPVIRHGQQKRITGAIRLMDESLLIVGYHCLMAFTFVVNKTEHSLY